MWGNGVQNEPYNGGQGDRGRQMVEGVGRPSWQRRRRHRLGSSWHSDDRPHLHTDATGTATCTRAPTETRPHEYTQTPVPPGKAGGVRLRAHPRTHDLSPCVYREPSPSLPPPAALSLCCSRSSRPLLSQ